METNTERNLVKNLKQILNESNSDFIGHLVLSDDFKYSILDNLKNLTLITRIVSERLECVQKEQYEKFYKEASNEGASIKYEENKTLLVYKSIGDDIEDFYDRIKMNKINFTDKRLVRDNGIDFRFLNNLLQHSHSVKTFHLSMLSDKEEKERLVNFKNETKLSKKEANYALSVGFRKSFLCIGDTIKDEMHVWDVVEPDPWQENIKRNFEESLKQTKKRITEEALEALEAYFQTDCESDSSDNFDLN